MKPTFPSSLLNVGLPSNVVDEVYQMVTFTGILTSTHLVDNKFHGPACLHKKKKNVSNGHLYIIEKPLFIQSEAEMEIRNCGMLVPRLP